MNLVKTSALSAIATLIKILSGFILNKVIAIYAGPSGLASIAQLQNFIVLIQTLSGDFLKTAVTKYTAQYSNENNLKYSLWSTAFKIQLILSILFFFVLFFSANQISYYLFSSYDYSSYIRVLGFFVPAFVLNSFILSILNGERDIKSYVALNIILNLTLMIFVSILLYFFEVEGGIVGYIIVPPVMFIISLFFIRRKEWANIKYFTRIFDVDLSKKILSFGAITFTSISVSALSLLFVRSLISKMLSLDDAGYWQAVWSLSQVAQSLIVTSLSTYLLPALAIAKTQNEISTELTKGYMLLVPVALLISGSIFFLRNYIIVVLYTEEFLVMENLFLWQMIGNVIKVCAWMIGYMVVAKSMVKTAIITEVIFGLLFIILMNVFCNQYGLLGTTYAFALNSTLHFITMLSIYFLIIKNNQKVING